MKAVVIAWILNPSHQEACSGATYLLSRIDTSTRSDQESRELKSLTADDFPLSADKDLLRTSGGRLRLLVESKKEARCLSRILTLLF